MLKPSTKDDVTSKIHQVKGKIKEEVGKATNNADLEASGKKEKDAAKIQKLISHVEKAIGE